MSKAIIDRREALKRATFLMGGTLSAPTILAILNGCTAKPGLDWIPNFFNERQALAVTRVADIIIPATNTPGASQVGVPAFIEQVVKDCYTPENQQRFLAELDSFIDGSVTDFGKEFTRLSSERQLDYVTRIHNVAVESEKANPENYKRPFILMCKELTLSGFLTSQVGAEQVLQYQAVPGSYEGCITLEEAGGKAWAT
ncbi:gluconate 2-dehydrogenase subunit 3 family protein [Oscillatoria amoena NRMC-F 0135]|nr:gluconate 2-dehydrogenase subunit 3 family protein [Oscillatoria amoena NRMC-F 0135]